MQLKTSRLVLRHWQETDAPVLYEYAKDPQVGPIAGWPVHTSVENSRLVIHDILSAEETYAVVPKNIGFPVGSIGLMIGKRSDLGITDNEGEIGYWVGVPHWGNGYMPEAVNELLRHGFEDLNLTCIWCGYIDGNEKSRRVQEKCGFQYHHTIENKMFPLIGELRTEHISRLTREEWLTRHHRQVQP